MKKFLFLLVFLPVVSSAQQVGTNYYWADSLAVSTTGFDSLFATPWEQVTIKFEGGSGYVKAGSPDTTSWSSRNWVLLNASETITFGPGTRLKRLQAKSSSGTIAIYLVGYKRRAQF